MRRFPLLVLAGILGIKKRRSVDASSGGRVPDSKNLATSMSFVNAYRALISRRSPLTGAVLTLQATCHLGMNLLM
jgi:hypothetical protein